MGLLHGDLGTSYKLQRSVTDLILQAFPRTMVLAFSAALVSWIIGIPAGILSAIRQYSVTDYFFMGFSLAGVSMPVFWSALLFQYVFALKLGWLPVAGFYGWRYVIMPAIVLGWSSAGLIARLTRSSLLDVMRNDYIRTARSKGARELAVITGHALKNAFAGSNDNGNTGGELAFRSRNYRKRVRNPRGRQSRGPMPLKAGYATASRFCPFCHDSRHLGNLVADILYSLLDPRIRLEK